MLDSRGRWGWGSELSLTAFFFIFVSGFFDDVVSDYLWGRSVLLTSPTVATVGLTLTIPMAIVVDLALGNRAILSSPLSLVGAALVVVGFGIVNVGCDGGWRCRRRGAGATTAGTAEAVAGGDA